MRAHEKLDVRSLPIFRDRADAGDALALSLSIFSTQSDVVVMGVARGGVPVARRVADALGAPLGVVVSRAIGVPGIEGVTLGAIAEGIDRVAADSVAWYIGVPPRIVERLAARERVELERRTWLYRSHNPMPDLRGRTVLLVDDGLATGATMRAAARAIRAHRPRRLIGAVPVASRLGAMEVCAEADELIAVFMPDEVEAIASFYVSYPRVTDDHVLALLDPKHRGAMTLEIVSDVLRDVSDRLDSGSPSRTHGVSPNERTIEIPVLGGALVADLGSPDRPLGSSAHAVHGLVILAQGRGGSRDSYRNRYIAGRLRLSGYATLRVDLLTNEEQYGEADEATLRFDVFRFARRLTSVCDWVVDEGIEGTSRVVLSGANTAAAASLIAASRRPSAVAAVIARGGHVQLAASVLPRVEARVLLIAGANDESSLQANTVAGRSLPRGATLLRIPRAGEGFDEPGALGAMTEQAVKWLGRLG